MGQEEGQSKRFGFYLEWEGACQSSAGQGLALPSRKTAQLGWRPENSKGARVPEEARGSSQMPGDPQRGQAIPEEARVPQEAAATLSRLSSVVIPVVKKVKKLKLAKVGLELGSKGKAPWTLRPWHPAGSSLEEETLKGTWNSLRSFHLGCLHAERGWGRAGRAQTPA